MAAQDGSRYQEITQELYSKNVDLVNANKVLELIQTLYDIMVTSYSLESVSQHFIDTITEKMGFTDGLVVARNRFNEHLQIMGATQSETNKTVMELAGIATTEIKFNLDRKENLLVSAYLEKKSKTADKLYDIWTPYIRKGDLVSSRDNVESRMILVYPIAYGEQVLGSFALVASNRGKELTSFEKTALERLVTVFGIAMDKVRMSEELQEAQHAELEQAHELIRLKDEFVFIATHDLRTPVTAIKGYSDLIEARMNEFDKDTKENLSAILESADRLDQLVEDLLEVARSESGTIEINTEPVDISSVIEEVRKEVETSVKEKSLNMMFSLSEQNMVMADREKLKEVLENLLSNAVKYNKDNGEIRVSSVPVGKSLKIEVADTGYGISKDLHSKVFTKFFRAHEKGTEGVAGTGLGLFVVKMLVEKMKGRIEFNSKLGEGTVFSLYLPLAG